MREEPRKEQPNTSPSSSGEQRPGERMLVCPRCGHANEPRALRCEACRKLIDVPAVPVAQPEAPAPVPAEAPAEDVPEAATPEAPPPTPGPSAPAEAVVHEELRFCPRCGHATPKKSAMCPSCGTLLGVARQEILAHQKVPASGYMGVIALVIAFAAMVIFYLFRTWGKVTFVGGAAAIGAGAWALNREEQPVLGVFAIIAGILDIFMVIVAPVM